MLPSSGCHLATILARWNSRQKKRKLREKESSGIERKGRQVKTGKGREEYRKKSRTKKMYKEQRKKGRWDKRREKGDEEQKQDEKGKNKIGGK